eukprot:TRINITY_DN5574_c1_g1_i10.p3 TRINITY_DN5574_c1_g1~~TRINITY_DN5574_c1_g1_i10.p3  ORF type:complete len:208 (+),score=-16.97 TRINITY_DN5574_c1_g1_i10:1670-2293(+)
MYRPKNYNKKNCAKPKIINKYTYIQHAQNYQINLYQFLSLSLSLSLANARDYTISPSQIIKYHHKYFIICATNTKKKCRWLGALQPPPFLCSPNQALYSQYESMKVYNTKIFRFYQKIDNPPLPPESRVNGQQPPSHHPPSQVHLLTVIQLRNNRMCRQSYVVFSVLIETHIRFNTLLQYNLIFDADNYEQPTQLLSVFHQLTPFSL